MIHENEIAAPQTDAEHWEKLALLYARFTLGAAFLSAVSSRFGLWDKTLDLKNFANFMEYAAQVNSFMPRAAIPFLAWTATAAEMSLGILLILGLWQRWVALASAILLVLFGTAMAISFGLKSPLDYSVFSASGAALMLSCQAQRARFSAPPDKGGTPLMKSGAGGPFCTSSLEAFRRHR